MTETGKGQKRTIKRWLRDAVFYEVYPPSFLDTNGDGIGDIRGIIRKLDYIRSLGCNALWLNPCFESPFYDGGYDVSDYYSAAPRYGTNEDLKELFSEAHRRGMHVLLDLVPGHTSVEHPWFRESMKAEKNEYTDRYVWTDSPYKRMEDVKGIVSILRGISPRYGTCGVNCFSTQPALNYGFARITDPDWQQPTDAPGPAATRRELWKIMRFWLQMGCDGFRVDMAGSLVKNDEDKAGTIRLWREIREKLDGEFPEAALVSEWGKPDVALRAGFDMDFFLHFGNTGYMDLFRGPHPFFAGDEKSDITGFAGTFEANQELLADMGLMCMPSGNHDMTRISYQLTGRQLAVAYAFLFAFPGAPFLYYGDEIGMRYLPGLVSVEGGYERTGSRTPMQWDKSANGGFSSAPPSRLYIQMDEEPGRPDVQEQEGREDSTLSLVRRLIALRRAHPALGNLGRLRFLWAKKGKFPLVFVRTDPEETEEVTVVLNPSGQEGFCADFGLADTEVLVKEGGLPRRCGDGSLAVPPLSFCWLKKIS